MNPTRFLVLGGTGILGRALVRRLGPDRVTVTGTRRGTTNGILFDALADDPGRLIDAHGPFDGVFLLFGLTAPDVCARRPEEARRLNVDAMGRAISACETRGLSVVFTSSEVVFDGVRGNYTEDDAPNPPMLYGRQKREVEEMLEHYRGRAVIARCARVLGAQPGDGSLLSGIMADILSGRIVSAAIDQRFSPILDDDAAAALIALLEMGASGVFHVAGPEALSRFDIASRCWSWLAAQGIPVRGRPEACRLADFPTLEPRPHDVSLCIDRLVTLTGWSPTSVSGILSIFWEHQTAGLSSNGSESSIVSGRDHDKSGAWPRFEDI